MVEPPRIDNVGALTEHYANYMGGGMPPDPPPPIDYGLSEQPSKLPENPQAAKNAGPASGFVDGVYFEQGLGLLDGMVVQLNEVELEAVRRIVAKAVEREVLGKLDEWRKTHSLLEAE